MNPFYQALNINVDRAKLQSIYYEKYHSIVTGEFRNYISVTTPQATRINYNDDYLALLTADVDHWPIHHIIDALNIERPRIRLFVLSPNNDHENKFVHIDYDTSTQTAHPWGINIPIGEIGGHNSWYSFEDNPTLDQHIPKDTIRQATSIIHATTTDLNISAQLILKQPTLFRTEIYHSLCNRNNPNIRIVLSIRPGTHSSKHPSWETIYNKVSEYNRTH